MIRTASLFATALTVVLGLNVVVGTQLNADPFGTLKAKAEQRHAEAATIVAKIPVVPLTQPNDELIELSLFFPKNELVASNVMTVAFAGDTIAQ